LFQCKDSGAPLPDSGGVDATLLRLHSRWLMRWLLTLLCMVGGAVLAAGPDAVAAVSHHAAQAGHAAHAADAADAAHAAHVAQAPVRTAQLQLQLQPQLQQQPQLQPPQPCPGDQPCDRCQASAACGHCASPCGSGCAAAGLLPAAPRLPHAAAQQRGRPIEPAHQGRPANPPDKPPPIA